MSSLFTTPISLANLLLLLGVRAAFLCTLVWFQLIKAMFTVPMDLCWMVMVWTTFFTTLPVRIFTALQRERMLETNLHGMQIQLESLAWENKELEEQLQMAIRERKVIETVFEEIEEEHEKSLSRIDLLENELQDLKEENMRLNEIQGKASWNYKSQVRGSLVRESDPLASNLDDPSWCFNHKGSETTVEDILMHKDSWGKEVSVKRKDHYFFKDAVSCPLSPREVSSDLTIYEAMECWRIFAFSRSLFSFILVLVVGTVIWKAEDPCLPLVVALFIVVGLSLKSVVQFFLTLKNKPASDAVALLSINWFILGTLTSPLLPSIARMLAPLFVYLADRAVTWLGLTVNLNG